MSRIGVIGNETVANAKMANKAPGDTGYLALSYLWCYKSSGRPKLGVLTSATLASGEQNGNNLSLATIFISLRQKVLSMAKILVVEDSAVDRALLGSVLGLSLIHI